MESMKDIWEKVAKDMQRKKDVDFVVEEFIPRLLVVLGQFEIKIDNLEKSVGELTTRLDRLESNR